MALRDELTDCIGCGCLSLNSCSIFNPGDAASDLGTGPRYLLGDNRDTMVTPRPSSGRSVGSPPL